MRLESAETHTSPPTPVKLWLARVVTLPLVACVACIVPDHGIQVLGDCGVNWCITIPMTGNGRAWGDQLGTDVAVMDIVNGNVTAINRCVCMTPSESALLEAGCAMPPCDPEFVEVTAELVNLTYEACLTASVENYQPDLSQNTAVVNPGNTCLEASAFWTPVKSEDWCSIPSDECDTDASPLMDGGGPEPFLSYTIPCTGGTCTVPDALVEAVDVDSDLLIHSATRLTQVKSGGVPIGLKFSGIVSNSLAYRLGFRNNDIVQQVNGLPFKVQSDLLAAFVELRAAETATVTVKRGTTTIYLNFVRQQPWP